MDTEETGVARRSGRKRLPNSRLQDMEVEITPRKSSTKKQRIQLEPSSSLKKPVIQKLPKHSNKIIEIVATETLKCLKDKTVPKRSSPERSYHPKKILKPQSDSTETKEGDAITCSKETETCPVELTPARSGVSEIASEDLSTTTDPASNPAKDIPSSTSICSIAVVTPEQESNPTDQPTSVPLSAPSIVLPKVRQVPSRVNDHDTIKLAASPPLSMSDHMEKVLPMITCVMPPQCVTTKSNAIEIPASDLLRIAKDASSAPSDSKSVVLFDLDSGEPKVISGKLIKEEEPSRTGGVKTLSDSSAVEVGEMEDEMMGLLNMFLHEVEDRKDVSLKDTNSTDLETNAEAGADGVHSEMHNLEQVSFGQNSSAEASTCSNMVPVISGITGLASKSSTVLLSEVAGELQVVVMKKTISDAKRRGSARSRLQDSDQASHLKEVRLQLDPGGTIDDRTEDDLQQIHVVVKTDPGVLQTKRLALEKAREEETNGNKEEELLKVTSEGLLTCTKCSYVTDKKVNWYKHKLKHRERRHKCKICDYAASTSSNMNRHMLSHRNIRNYACDMCDCTFKQKIHLDRHKKYKHEERRIQCMYCDYVCFNTHPDLFTHLKKKHSEFCHFDKDGKANLLQSNPLVPVDSLMKYKCNECNLYAVSRKDLQQHVKFHKKGTELKFFCEMCSFVTECKSRLSRHLLTHTKERPFKCEYCSYSASEAEHIKRHMFNKHKVEPTKGIRRKPIKLKTKDQCKTGPDDVKSLLMHSTQLVKKSYPIQDTRNSEKYFACNFCTMKFTKLINLFKHVHVQHKQLMPYENVYSCVVCDYCTNYYKRLLVHMRKMHSTTNCMNTPQKQVYVCMLCNYYSPYRLYLHAHLKKEHNMQLVSDKEGVNKYMLDASKHSSVLVQTTEEADRKKPGSIIKRTSSGKIIDPESPTKDSKMVLLQLTPDGPMTPVIISMGNGSEGGTSTSLLNETDPENEYPIMETGISDAATSLDMACEDDDLQQVLQDTSVIDAVPVSSATEESTIFEVVEHTVDIAEALVKESSDIASVLPSTQVVDIQVLASDNSVVSPSVEEVDEAQGEENANAEETSENDQDEVVHLSSGDFVEINGQLYKVEMETSDKSDT